jgi:hypothetical protein
LVKNCCKLIPFTVISFLKLKNKNINKTGEGRRRRRREGKEGEGERIPLKEPSREEQW